VQRRGTGERGASRGARRPLDPKRAKQEIEAKRARLALFDWALTETGRLLADDDAEKINQGAAIGCCEAARTGVKLDAAVYRDHPGYQQEWKP
jgi:Family of unknown function (DUF6221)